jgi:RNA polymerase sigma factor (sigma-70 family)
MNTFSEIGMDSTWWDAMRDGDKAAFANLYERYFKLLYNYGKKIGVDADTLEDAIHDLFVDLWRFRENLSPTSSVKFYLYRSLRRRVKRNMSASHYLTSHEFALEDMLQHMAPSSEQRIIDDEIHQQQVDRLRKLLDDLAPRQYEALILRFYDELSFEEIGSILSVNEQSARNLVQRGLVQLKQYARHVITLSFLLASV